ncbi:hypothetical protein DM01DRAFT_1404897 [Hesseltinella vesiculosa]|uniref:Uncharacterized protein n=1 Tax=Hesseltinella vesiculosa TaxID=101127 RepID=A0A1X2GT76_9FUNG|nr:hypothetical protein DM01DRAFT_1404897 [Hesseltinella vesiculosa]
MEKNLFVVAGRSGKKVVLEHLGHPCPKCKALATVQLTRTERQLILFNRRIKDTATVRYECHACDWKNRSLPETWADDKPRDRLAQSPSLFSLPTRKKHLIHPNPSLHSLPYV